ncbi:MAG: SprT-like domain-containing protein [Spirosomaceae bacterium]|nr:SprT-like domain-containing protein [Spirosomataceae bacterium]
MLAEKIPKNAVEYAFNLWKEQPFSFTVARTRSTCLGNYSFRNNRHKITVNHDLNPYQFLITYIHEVAHQHVFIQFMQGKRKRVLPHGSEWKSTFQELMKPLLNEGVFPSTVLNLLRLHMTNPPASTVRDGLLLKALQQFDNKPITEEKGLRLEEINEGETFIFKNRIFKKLETRRTRVLCLEKNSNRKFTIPKVAVVEKI